MLLLLMGGTLMVGEEFQTVNLFSPEPQNLNLVSLTRNAV